MRWRMEFRCGGRWPITTVYWTTWRKKGDKISTTRHRTRVHREGQAHPAICSTGKNLRINWVLREKNELIKGGGLDYDSVPEEAYCEKLRPLVSDRNRWLSRTGVKTSCSKGPRGPFWTSTTGLMAEALLLLRRDIPALYGESVGNRC